MCLSVYPQAAANHDICYAMVPGVFDILHKCSSPMLMIVVRSPLRALVKDQVGKCCLCQPIVLENMAWSHGRQFLYSLLQPSDYTDRCGVERLSSKSGPIIWKHWWLMKHTVWISVKWNSKFLEWFWGDTFRKEFSKIGEVCRTLPNRVNVMALTATATKATWKNVFQKLGMKNPVVIYQSDM